MVGENPYHIIPLIQGARTDNNNLAGGLVGEQHATGTQTGYDQGHFRGERTHMTPIDSNYPSEGMSVESEKEIIRLRMEKKILMQMLKEQMVNNGRVALKGTGPERSHVCSTREEHIPDVHESTSGDKVKRPMGLSKFDVAADRRECGPHKPSTQPTVFDRLGGTITQTGRVTSTEARPTNWAE